jgi:DNA repair and recombination RAD54-like protein
MKRPLGPQGMLALLTRTVQVQPPPVGPDGDYANAPEVVLFDPATDRPEPAAPEGGARPWARVTAEPFLAAKLRPHQVEGVRFMFRCLTGLQDPLYAGCIQ